MLILLIVDLGREVMRLTRRDGGRDEGDRDCIPRVSPFDFITAVVWRILQTSGRETRRQESGQSLQGEDRRSQTLLPPEYPS